MTTSDAWFRFFAAAVLAVSGTAFGAFQFSLDPKEIQPGQRTVLTLRLPEADLIHPEGASEELLPEAQDELLLKNDKIELLDQEYRKENGEFVWRYQFTSYDLGELTIPPLLVTLGPQTFSTERMTLTVQTQRAPEDGELRPDAGAVRPPLDWGFWIPLLALLAAAAVAYFTRKYWLPKVEKAAAPKAPVAPEEDPLVWLRRHLLRLRARLDTTPNDATAPDAWSSVLREFGERQSHLPVMAWTTRELRERLGSDAKWFQIARIMQECDRFKFAHVERKEDAGRKTLDWIEESEKVFF